MISFIYTRKYETTLSDQSIIPPLECERKEMEIMFPQTVGMEQLEYYKFVDSLYTRNNSGEPNDGGVTVRTTANKSDAARVIPEVTDMTLDEYIDFIKDRDICSSCTNIVVCDHTEVPTDRTFRDAWEQDANKAVKVNMPKARIIHMDRIRQERNEKLKKVSVSDEKPVPEIETIFVNERKAELEKLRDIPQTFDLEQFTTPEALKAAWPDELK